jgi:hypothetical protein
MKGLGLTLEQRLARMDVALTHRHVRYHLGKGGRRPAAVDCSSAGKVHPREADCSGFAAWVTGIDRWQPGFFPIDGGWISTSGAVEDARSLRPVAFEEVPRWEAAPGDWLVYPDGLFTQGHVVLVRRVLALSGSARRAAWTDRLVYVHCSGGADRRLGYAISTMPVPAVTRRATVLRPREDFLARVAGADHLRAG